MSDRYSTPIVLLAFNRPDATRKVLEIVLAQRPRTLYVVADGPRPEVPSDVETCRATRALFDDLPAEVELHRLYSEGNMGVRRRVASGLDEVLEREEQAVILEDDCLAHASFFGYCEALLERFRDDERVASITGSNTQGNRINAEARSYSYHFSAVGMPWGWATWRRAWRAYDARLELWPAFRRSGWLRDRLGHVAGGQWERVLDNAHEVDSWWVRWCMSCWCQGRLAIVPRVNLITNLAGKIQEGETTEAAIAARFGNLPTHPLESPLMHPPFVVRDPVAERRVLETMLPWSPVGRTVKQVLIEGHGTLRRFFPGGQ
ncbi:MAG: glycosyltransferase family 2 protein [Myxococcales bacterium]|nr:hypothetical protein [Myxococcales bacterium]MCB9715922.1 glycosyltransferase family 2 protein [Myxococcales bacterium]